MSGDLTYSYLPADTTVTRLRLDLQSIAPDPQAKDESGLKKSKHDSLGVHRKKDSTKLFKAPPIERFKLPDTIKIEYVKPAFKIKRAKIDSSASKANLADSDTGYIKFYNNHELKVIHTNPVQINKENYDWIFYVLLFIVGAFTFIKVIHFKNLKQIREAFLSTTMSNQIVRDESILFQRASVFLTVIFYVVGALLLYKLSVIYDVNYPYLPGGFGRFLIFVLLISMAYSLKLIILKMIGFVFQIDKAITTYIFNVFLINNVLGIILIPILICICFMPSQYIGSIVVLAEVLVVTAFLYRVFRGITIGLSYPNFSVYYLFLYLCSLEIAPLLFLVRMLV